MRIAAMAAALVLLWVGAAHAQSQWKEFNSAKGGFAVSFPVAPKIKEGPDQQGYPDHQFEVDLGDVDYFVAYTEYPAGYFARREANEFLDKLVGGLTGDDGKIRLSRKISTAGNLGREYIVDKPDATVTAHFFIVGNLLFGQILVGPKGLEGGADAKRFFDSFRLVVQ